MTRTKTRDRGVPDVHDPAVQSQHSQESGHQRGIGGFTNWLNGKLLPYIGPPPLGPYDEEPKAEKVAVCPICGKPMSEHAIDRTAHDTFLRCP